MNNAKNKEQNSEKERLRGQHYKITGRSESVMMNKYAHGKRNVPQPLYNN